MPHRLLPRALVLLASALPLAAQCELAGPSASDGLPADAFGKAVAIEGDRALVGATGEPVSAAAFGVVCAFERGPSGWVETQQVVAPDPEMLDFFGISLALSGTTLLVGALRHDHGPEQDAGAAYVFEYRAGTWVFVQELLPSDPTADLLFGRTVALVGDTALVSASSQPVPPGGFVYVFERDATGWHETQKLTPSDDPALARFGTGLAVRDGLAFVGAPFREEPTLPAALAGAVYVYEQDALGWHETQILLSDPVVPGLLFGCALDLDGDRLLVGASGFLFTPGAAYVFESTQTGWSQTAEFSPDGLGFDERFGRSVALQGERAWIGMPGAESIDACMGLSCDSGTVFLFERDGVRWNETARVVGSDTAVQDNLGSAVALDGDTGLAGAPAGGFSTNVGSAHFFALDSGFRPYGAGTNGTGGLTPRLGATACPVPGRAFPVEVGAGRGGACGCLLVGASEANSPFAGGLLLVGDSISITTHALDGRPGAAGAGSASIRLDVPLDPALSGLTFFAQAGYIDPEAVFGVSLTNGLRMTID